MYPEFGCASRLDTADLRDGYPSPADLRAKRSPALLTVTMFGRLALAILGVIMLTRS